MRFRSQTLGFFLPLVLVSAVVMTLLIVTGTLFVLRSRNVMEAQLKSELRNTAALAALQFDAGAIDGILAGATPDSSPALRDATLKLRRIRESTDGIRFAYIMRKTADPALHEFVADADLGLPADSLDRNRNGVIDPDEKPAQPGERYDWSPSPVLGQDAFLRPTADEDISFDQWGAVISGYAPIMTEDGRTVAVLGIDKSAGDFMADIGDISSPVALLLMLIAIICIALSGIILFLRRRSDILEQIEAERSGLLRLAFHQLGGPLTIISWSLEELEEEALPSVRKSVVNIQQGVKRLTEIMNTLKNADLVHEGKIEYKPEFVGLSTVLKQATEGLELKLAERKQRVDLALQDNITMQIDLHLIAGVVRELLTNAIDYSPDGAVITVSSRRMGRYAEFSVEDHGCGIPQKDMPRIFGEFTRGSNATTFKADGNGLGLYIVKGILKHAGGSIGIKSKEGKGTTVTVRLPMA
ncbi:MAG: HAMP domain-containing sensor histidine kinase [Candidatus Peribacteraceae bacterium]|nr:HAMP domain-containing sensor histidine kinase [Candidatus Peribacteraceae bacterium]